ncbi:MAG: tetratricopeptide repeat protein [Bacteroidetes bacterium]|nr:tetratricopeptide repeat protein [Bacteroidota bacterium]HET6243925.1 tetratricopeptide repeat protein [Bacteroidia bacterium]
MNKGFLFSILFSFFFIDINANQQGREYFLVDSVNYNELPLHDKAILDSLLPLFHKAKHDTIKLNLLGAIVEQCMDDNLWPKYNLLMFNIAQNALADPSTLKKEEFIALKLKLADALANIGFFNLNNGDLNKALGYFQKSLYAQKGMSYNYGMASALLNLGYIYKSKGEIVKALDYYGKALKVFEKINHLSGIANALNNIGLIYKNQGEIDKALENYNKSLAIWKEVNNNRQLAATLTNIGYIYYAKKNEEKALEYYFQALEIDESNGDKRGIASSLNSIGLVYYNKNELPDALAFFNKSLVINKEIGNKKGIAESLNSLGLISWKVNEIEKAHTFGSQALEIAKESGYPKNIADASELLSKVYKAQKNWKEAFNMYELQIKMRDSIFNEETQKAAIKQQMNYENEKQKVLKEAEYQNKIAIEKEAKKRQKVLNFATGAGLIIMLIFAGFIYTRFRYSQKQKGIIEQQKQQVELAYQQLSEKNKDITDSINYAKRIQNAILKEEDQVSEHLPEHFIFFKPKDIVSGDFYWSLEKQFPSEAGLGFCNYWYFAAGDCTGHGVPGAFMSMLGVAFLNEITGVERFISPSEILDHLRTRIIKELNQAGKQGDSNDGMDISIACLNLSNFELQWSGSNNPLYIISQNNYNSEFVVKSEIFDIQLSEIKPNKQPIGFHPSPIPFTNHCLQLQKDTSIYLLTDGFADQFGGLKGKKFKYSQLKELLLANNLQSMAQQKEILNNVFKQWKGNLEQVDDVCLMGVRI